MIFTTFGNFTDFKAFFPAMLTGFYEHWSQSKVDKNMEGTIIRKRKKVLHKLYILNNEEVYS